MSEDVVIEGPAQTGLAKVEERVAPLMTRENREVIQAMAYDIFAAGKGFLPKHIETEEQARITMYYGYEIGLPPMAALMEVYIVHGRPGLQTKAMLALVDSRPDLGYYEWGLCDEREANITMYKNTPDRGYIAQPFRFTMEDAQRAGIAGDMYKKYPRPMLRSRVGSEAVRVTFPGLLLGCAYTPEELGAPMLAVGEQVEVDVAALTEGRVVKQNALPEPDPDGGPDFDAAPPRGQALDTAPSEEELARADIIAAVGAVAEALFPPEDGPPMWATEADPSTKKQVFDLIRQIGISEEYAKVLGATAIAAGNERAENIWKAVAGWWYDGELPAKLFAGLCAQAGVAFEINPFRPSGPSGPPADDDQPALDWTEEE